jgi:hypothetical protein
MAKYQIHHYQQNIYGKLHKLFSTLKLRKMKSNIYNFGRNQHNIHGRFFYTIFQSMIHHHIQQTCNQFLNSQNNTKTIVHILCLWENYI